MDLDLQVSRARSEALAERGIFGQLAVTGASVTFLLCCDHPLHVTGMDVREAYRQGEPGGLLRLIDDALLRHEAECAIYGVTMALLRLGEGVSP